MQNVDASGDLRAVEDFLSYIPKGQAFPSLYTTPYLTWKVETNPFGPSGLYLRRVGETPAAHCSVTAKPANDHYIPGLRLAELGDTHTHPDFQKQGHFGALGQHAIAACQSAAPEPALIYGLPNQNALPGWLRHCGCEVFDAMAIVEMALDPGAAIAARFRPRPVAGRGVRIHWGAAEDVIERTVNETWSRVAAEPWLVRKDAAWWRWRYRDASETYATGVIRTPEGHAGWVVTKTTPTRWPLVSRASIADIVATSDDVAVAVLQAVVMSTSPLARVGLWCARQTEAHRVATALGFQQVRDVPVIFVTNEALQFLRQQHGVPRLSLGDTDNV